VKTWAATQAALFASQIFVTGMDIEDRSIDGRPDQILPYRLSDKGPGRGIDP
jgi:hypothetical protein